MPAPSAIAISKNKNRIMDLDLECHLNWVFVEDASPAMMDSTLEERARKWSGLNGNSASLFEKFAHFASQVVFAHWIDDYDSACTSLTSMEEVVGSEELEPEHTKAYEYIIEANRAVLDYRMALFEASEKAQKKASQINTDNPKTKALILSMKAGVIGFFGNTRGRVDLCRQVVELDPDVPHYLESYFRAIRKIRREKDYLSAPSELEAKLMEQAYALAVDSPSVLQSITTFYYDILKKKLNNPQFTCPIIQDIGIQELVRKLKEFARQAANASPESAAAGIQLAEILCCGETGNKDDEECRQEAKDQYLYCMKTWRDDSNVLHKVGKFMCNSDEDFELGLQLIKLSVRSERGNFPAFMDYMRLVSSKKSRDHEGLAHMLGLIEKQIPIFLRKPTMCSRTYCLKATLLCKKNKHDQAVEFWLKAINMDPELFTRDTTAMLGKGVFRGLFTGPDYNELRTHLTKTIENEPVDSGRLEGLKKIIGAMSSNTPRRDDVKPTCAGQIRGGGPGPLRKLNADNDNNWRA